MLPSVVGFVRHLTAATPRPWLLVGKGPSCARLAALDLSAYHVFTLNHACCLTPTFAVAHFVDVEAAAACENFLLAAVARTAGRLCLPWHPHVTFKPATAPLVPSANAAVSAYQAAGKLVSYNATTAGRLPRHHALPVVTLRQFSAVAAVNVLALAGVKVVHAVGVDGGTEYHSAFAPADKLSNGRPSFDSQWPWIRKTVAEFGIAWRKL